MWARSVSRGAAFSWQLGLSTYGGHIDARSCEGASSCREGGAEEGRGAKLGEQVGRRGFGLMWGEVGQGGGRSDGTISPPPRHSPRTGAGYTLVARMSSLDTKSHTYPLGCVELTTFVIPILTSQTPTHATSPPFWTRTVTSASFRLQSTILAYRQGVMTQQHLGTSSLC